MLGWKYEACGAVRADDGGDTRPEVSTQKPPTGLDCTQIPGPRSRLKSCYAAASRKVEMRCSPWNAIWVKVQIGGLYLISFNGYHLNFHLTFTWPLLNLSLSSKTKWEISFQHLNKFTRLNSSKILKTRLNLCLHRVSRSKLMFTKDRN